MTHFPLSAELNQGSPLSLVLFIIFYGPNFNIGVWTGASLILKRRISSLPFANTIIFFQSFNASNCNSCFLKNQSKHQHISCSRQQRSKRCYYCSLNRITSLIEAVWKYMCQIRKAVMGQESIVSPWGVSKVGHKHWKRSIGLFRRIVIWKTMIGEQSRTS